MKQLSSNRRRSRGFSLVVSMILLVVVLMAALAGMRSVMLESRMSATSYDRGLAFQASETALREAEDRAVVATAADFPASAASSVCANGYCAEPAPTDQARWTDADFAGWRNADAGVSTNAETPAAIIENHGEGDNWLGCSQEIPRQPNCRTPRYRITGRSAGDGRANVILQSDVATQ